MNAKRREFKKGGLFLGLGILAQGEFQQPVDGVCPRFKAMGKAKVIKFLTQLLFQAQVKH